eukprot:6500-Pelagococcus_subviridis.AAC.1
MTRRSGSGPNARLSRASDADATPSSQSRSTHAWSAGTTKSSSAPVVDVMTSPSSAATRRTITAGSPSSVSASASASAGSRNATTSPTCARRGHGSDNSGRDNRLGSKSQPGFAAMARNATSSSSSCSG